MKVEEIVIWEAFQAVAKFSSFSEASRKLRIGVPQLSKRVAKLEERLGVKLFRRSTRVVSLTDEGKSLFPRINSVLEDLAGIESSFEAQENLTGTIRLASVPFVAQRLLIPSLERFLKQYPQIRFELDLTEQFTNLIDANIDIAIRIHDKPDDSNLIYRKLVPNDLVLCASKKYLKTHGTPCKIEELAKHKILMLDIHRHCRFQNKQKTLGNVSMEKQFSCDNGWFLTELALQDFGILVRSIWDVEEHLRSGRLVRILQNFTLTTYGHIYAVISERRFLAPRVRTFLDFIIDEAARWKVV